MVFCVKTDVKNSLIFAALASSSVNVLLTCWPSSAPTSFLTVFLLFSFFLSPFSRHTYFFCSSLIFLFSFELPHFMGAPLPLLGNLFLSFPFVSFLSDSVGAYTVFVAWLSYVFAGRFRSTDHMQDWLAICFLIIVLPSWGPTPFILLFYILTEQCVTPPHPQSCSLTHGGLCRATHSPGSVAAQKTETGTFAWTLPPEACEIPRIFDGFLS